MSNRDTCLLFLIVAIPCAVLSVWLGITDGDPIAAGCFACVGISGSLTALVYLDMVGR